jgi:tRNA(Ile)-lysidine synthase TilS/MesJ
MKKTKLFLHLKKWLEMAVMDYSMIEEGDRVLVGVSGGMDSLSLLAEHADDPRPPVFTSCCEH